MRIVGPPHLGVVRGLGSMEGCRRRLLDARPGPPRNPGSRGSRGPLAHSSADLRSGLPPGPGRGCAFAQRVDLRGSRGHSSEAEHQLPKLRTGVRFPSPALAHHPSPEAIFADFPSCRKPPSLSFVPQRMGASRPSIVVNSNQKRTADTSDFDSVVAPSVRYEQSVLCKRHSWT